MHSSFDKTSRSFLAFLALKTSFTWNYFLRLWRWLFEFETNSPLRVLPKASLEDITHIHHVGRGFRAKPTLTGSDPQNRDVK